MVLPFTPECCHEAARARRKRIEALVIAKGIDPNGSKFLKLVYRMIRSGRAYDIHDEERR